MAVTKRNGIKGKKCSTCKKWKPLTEYHKDPSHGESQGRRHCRCKKCYLEKRKEKRQKNKKNDED